MICTTDSVAIFNKADLIETIASKAMVELDLERIVELAKEIKAMSYKIGNTVPHTTEDKSL